MNLAQFLWRTARAEPRRPALFLGTRQLADYGLLAARAAAIAGYLRHTAGLQPGDRVALVLPNCAEYLELLYGIWWAGLAAVPVNYKLHTKEVAFILEDSGAAAAFVADDTAALAVAGCLPPSHLFVPGGRGYMALLSAALWPLEERAADDLAWLFYTSGTTGRPKGVMLTHGNLQAMTACYFADVDAVSAESAILYAAPMSHGAGLYNFPHVLKGARHVVPESGGFDPAEVLAVSKAIGQVAMFAAPTMVKRLTEHVVASGADVAGIKTIVYGGGPMYVEDLKRALAAMGDRFVQIYGQGESPMTITALSRAQIADRTQPRWEERIASVGTAQAVVEVRVAGPDGVPLPDGEIGEVLVRGPTVMAGYWNNPAATAQALRGGWLWTGDLGAFDSDGFLTLKDRSKDLIISGGSNIYPREVEEVLLQHPRVAEVAVLGKADPEWGEVVTAFVVGSEVSAADLDALCLRNIARFKRPKEYHFVAALPKNNYGKVLKTALRDLLRAP